jgi:hypothetical protein
MCTTLTLAAQTGLVEKELTTLIAEAREEFPLKLPKEVMGE